MTTEEAVRHLRSEIGKSWPKCKPIPNPLLLRLCDRVWENGGNPSTVSIRRLLSYYLGCRSLRCHGMAQEQKSAEGFQATHASGQRHEIRAVCRSLC